MIDHRLRAPVFRWLPLFLALAVLVPAGGFAQLSPVPGGEDGNDAASGSVSADAPPTSVTAAAMGEADIRDRNTASARRRAVADGMEAALRQAAFAAVGPESAGANLARFLDTLSGRAETLVESYRVLGTASAGNRLRVLVEATFPGETLRARLASFLAPVPPATDPEVPVPEADGRPRVLLLMAQQDLEDISPEFWWGEGPGPDAVPAESALAEALRGAGLAVVEHGAEVPDVAVQGAIIFQPDLNDREALEIARSLNADLALVGKAIVYRTPDSDGEETPSFNATVTARVLRVETGEELDSVLETVVRAGGDSDAEGRAALAAAGEQAGRRLADALSGMAAAAPVPDEEPATPAPVPAGGVEIRVSGAGNLGNFVRFRRSLTELEGVSDLQIRRMQGDEATLSVSYPDGADALAAALADRKFDLFSLSVRAEDLERLRVALVPR